MLCRSVGLRWRPKGEGPQAAAGRGALLVVVVVSFVLRLPLPLLALKGCSSLHIWTEVRQVRAAGSRAPSHPPLPTSIFLLILLFLHIVAIIVLVLRTDLDTQQVLSPPPHPPLSGAHLDSLLHQVGQAHLVLLPLRTFLVLVLILVSYWTGLVLVLWNSIRGVIRLLR